MGLQAHGYSGPKVPPHQRHIFSAPSIHRKKSKEKREDNHKDQKAGEKEHALSDSALARKLAEEEEEEAKAKAATPPQPSAAPIKRRNSFELSDSVYARKLQDELSQPAAPTITHRPHGGLSDSDLAAQLRKAEESELKKMDDEYIARLLAEEENSRPIQPPPDVSDPYNVNSFYNNTRNNNNTYNTYNNNNNDYNNRNNYNSTQQPDIDHMTYEVREEPHSSLSYSPPPFMCY